MPGSMTLLPNGKYRVTWDGKVTAKETTKKKAVSQLRLLQYIEDKAHPGAAFQRRLKEKRKRAWANKPRSSAAKRTRRVTR